MKCNIYDILKLWLAVSGGWGEEIDIERRKMKRIKRKWRRKRKRKVELSFLKKENNKNKIKETWEER